MKVIELYPYFNDAHDELIERLQWVHEARWDAKPAHIEAPSIRQAVLRLIDEERFWVIHIAQKSAWDRVTGSDFPGRERLIEGVRAARASTLRYIDALEPASLKAVRTIPADPLANRPEINQPISWILHQVMRNDINALAQISMRLAE